jgi:hypothetical protein
MDNIYLCASLKDTPMDCCDGHVQQRLKGIGILEAEVFINSKNLKYPE